MIKITDPRLSEDRISVSAENVTVQIIPEPIERTYQSVQEDGSVVDIKVNEPQESRETTLKEETAKEFEVGKEYYVDFTKVE